MILEAIMKINPKAEVTVDGDDINSITWDNGTTPISKSDIEAQFPIIELDMAMQDLRAKRNRLLQDTDFHALSDNTMSVEMTTYRQELRDITEGITTVEQANAVVFPTKP
jgi:propanediol dehydratase large subunit